MRLELDQSFGSFPLTNDKVHRVNSHTEQKADEMLERGIAAARDGDRAQARVLLQHAVEMNSDSETAWLWLASISEYPEELLVFLDRVLRINPENKRAIEWKVATRSLLAKTFIQRGVDAANDGQRSHAVQCFSQALQYDEQNQTASSWINSLAGTADGDELVDGGVDANHFREVVADGSLLTMVPTAPPEIAPVASDRMDAEFEPVPLRPMMSAEYVHENGPTQELVFPETMLDSNPFESFAEDPTVSAAADDIVDEQPADYPEITFTKYVPDNVIVMDEAVHEVSAYLDESWSSRTMETPVNADRDVQEVLAAASLEDFGQEYAGNFRSEAAPEEPLADVHTDQSSGLSDYTGESCCPFCKTDVGHSDIVCSSCGAMLTMSDIEALIAHQPFETERLQQAVGALEVLRQAGHLDRDAVVNLAIAYLNLDDLESAQGCLQEASALDPNNVVISSQLTTLAIRIDEIRNRDERRVSAPEGKTILVVDDSATVRKLIAGKLEKSGHEVYCAEDGVQAISMLENLKPDLILLDIHMPKMDGYQVCKTVRAREATKNVPVIMISGKDGFFDEARGRIAGSTDHITKPFGPEALMKTVGTHLQNGSSDVKVDAP